MCEMYPINQKGCIVQRLVYYCIQINWNYVSLNGSSNREIFLLCINVQVTRLWLCLFWNGGGISYLVKGGGLLGPWVLQGEKVPFVKRHLLPSEKVPCNCASSLSNRHSIRIEVPFGTFSDFYIIEVKAHNHENIWNLIE